MQLNNGNKQNVYTERCSQHRARRRGGGQRREEASSVLSGYLDVKEVHDSGMDVIRPGRGRQRRSGRAEILKVFLRGMARRRGGDATRRTWRSGSKV